jgi:hypothetical protein
LGVLKRPLSALLAVLVAWLCAGAVERSATATRLGDPSAAASDAPAVLGHLTRPDRAIARPHATRAGDGAFGAFLLASVPTVPPPSLSLARRSDGAARGETDAGFTERGARGPPADLS